MPKQLIPARGTPSNNSMHPTRVSSNLIVNLAVGQLNARRVMPGVGVAQNPTNNKEKCSCKKSRRS